MKRLIAALLLAGFMAPRVMAGGAGTTAASFLKIDPSAREAALAGAVTGLAADDSASLINYNPALIAAADRKQMSFTHTGWLSGVQLESLSYTHPYLETMSFGAGVNYLHTPSIQKTDSNGGTLDSSFNSADGVFSLAAANRFHRNVLAGVAVKAIRQSMDGHSATAFAADGGILVRYSVVSLGLAISNLGTELNLYDQASPLPTTYKAGLAIRANHNFTLLVEGDKPADSNAIFRAGAEYAAYGVLVPTDRYSLRAGYRTSTSENAGPGFTLGAGLKIKSFAIDYCFVPMGDLGNTSRISVSIGFGESRDDGYSDEYSAMFHNMQNKTQKRYSAIPQPVSTFAPVREDAEPSPESDEDIYKPRLKDPRAYLEKEEEEKYYGRTNEAFSPQDKARTRAPRRSSKSPAVKSETNAQNRVKKVKSTKAKNTKKSSTSAQKSQSSSQTQWIGGDYE